MEQQDKGVKAEERKGHTGVFNLEVEAPSQLFLASVALIVELFQ